MDKVTTETVSTDHNLYEEIGEPKRYRTEVLLLTSLTPYRWAKPAHSAMFGVWEALYVRSEALRPRSPRGLRMEASHGTGHNAS